jgi:hypothetical protein
MIKLPVAFRPDDDKEQVMSWTLLMAFERSSLYEFGNGKWL